MRRVLVASWPALSALAAEAALLDAPQLAVLLAQGPTFVASGWSQTRYRLDTAERRLVVSQWGLEIAGQWRQEGEQVCALIDAERTCYRVEALGDDRFRFIEVDDAGRRVADEVLRRERADAGAQGRAPAGWASAERRKRWIE